jgi:hypothetical protein
MVSNNNYHKIHKKPYRITSPVIDRCETPLEDLDLDEPGARRSHYSEDCPTRADEEPNFRLFRESKGVCKNYKDYSRLMTNKSNNAGLEEGCTTTHHDSIKPATSLAPSNIDAVLIKRTLRLVDARALHVARISKTREKEKEQQQQLRSKYEADFHRKWKQELSDLTNLGFQKEKSDAVKEFLLWLWLEWESEKEMMEYSEIESFHLSLLAQKAIAMKTRTGKGFM